MRDLFRNELPFLRGAKWYRLFLESDGSAHKITKSTIEEATTSGGKLYFPHDLNIVDIKLDVHNVEFDSGNVNVADILALTPSGATCITLPSAKSYDYMYVYVLAVRR